MRVFASGPNHWLEAGTYPLPGTSLLRLYLASETGANSSIGDGKLQLQTPSHGRSHDVYVYDPADPTPSLWYDGLGGYESNVASREDVLVYETMAFSEPVVVMGLVSAKLYASSSAKDTDWFAYWHVVDDQGQAVPLGRGTVRARFRNSPRFPEALTENEICQYNLDLWHMGIRIEQGWRIRLEVASACFPAFSRNLNTGGCSETGTEYVAANQRIYHTEAYPSQLILSIMDGEE